MIPHHPYPWRPPGVGAIVPGIPANPEKPGDRVETFTTTGVKTALANITPTLILVGIATGMAFAIGSGLVSRYVFDQKHK